MANPKAMNAAAATAAATRRYQAARTPQAKAKAAKSLQANVKRLQQAAPRPNGDAA